MARCPGVYKYCPGVGVYINFVQVSWSIKVFSMCPEIYEYYPGVLEFINIFQMSWNIETLFRCPGIYKYCPGVIVHVCMYIVQISLNIYTLTRYPVNIYIVQVSWMRRQDGYPIIIGKEKYINDDRFELISTR